MKRSLLSALTLAAATLLAANAPAAEYWVAKNHPAAADGNPGTAEKP